MTDQKRKSRHPFGLLLASSAVSSLGDSFRLLAVNVWIFTATDGSTAQRLVLVLLANVPGLLLGGLSGVIADRWNKFTVLLTADLVRIGVSLGLAVCAYTLSPDYALVLVLIGNALGVFFTSSSFSLLPRVVPAAALPRANGLLETAGWVTQIVGPSLAAVTLFAAGPTTAFLIDAASFVVSATLLLQMRRSAGVNLGPIRSAEASDDGTSAGRTRLIESFVDGCRIILRDAQIRSLLLASYGVTFLVACTNYALIFLVADSLSLPAASLGFVYSLNGGVAVLAATLAAWFLSAKGLGRALAFSILGLCIAQVVMGLSPNLWILGLGVAVSALSNAPYNVAITTLYQERVPAEFLGRVEGVDVMLDNAVSILAFIVAFVTVSVTDARVIFLASAAVALPSLIVAFRRVAARDFRADVEFTVNS